MSHAPKRVGMEIEKKMEMSLDDIIKAARSGPSNQTKSRTAPKILNQRSRVPGNNRRQERNTGYQGAGKPLANQVSGTKGVRQAAQARRRSVPVRVGRVGGTALGARQTTIAKGSRNVAQIRAAQKILRRARTGVVPQRTGPSNRVAPLHVNKPRWSQQQRGAASSRTPVVFNPQNVAPKYTLPVRSNPPARGGRPASNFNRRAYGAQNNNQRAPPRGFQNGQRRGGFNAGSNLNRTVGGGVRKTQTNQRAPITTTEYDVAYSNNGNRGRRFQPRGARSSGQQQSYSGRQQNYSGRQQNYGGGRGNNRSRGGSTSGQTRAPFFNKRSRNY